MLVHIGDGYTIACSYAALWEKCAQGVLHAVTGSVRCLLCPSITKKLLSNNSKPSYNHAPKL